MLGKVRNYENAILLMCSWLVETADSFHGAQRRRFIAQTVEALDLSQRQAALLLGWARGRRVRGKALMNSTPGSPAWTTSQLGGVSLSKPHPPHLLDDIPALVHDQLQTDPTFQTTRLYCRVSAAEVRKQLIDRKGYPENQMPSIQTITTKLN